MTDLNSCKIGVAVQTGRSLIKGVHYSSPNNSSQTKSEIIK